MNKPLTENELKDLAQFGMYKVRASTEIHELRWRLESHGCLGRMLCGCVSDIPKDATEPAGELDALRRVLASLQESAATLTGSWSNRLNDKYRVPAVSRLHEAIINVLQLIDYGPTDATEPAENQEESDE